MQSSSSRQMGSMYHGRQGSIGLAALLVGLQASVAHADWGQNWGELTWGLAGIPAPGLEGWGVLLLAIAFVAVTQRFVSRHRGARMALLMLLALTVSLTAHAATIVVPNTFSNGTAADATEVNTNFTALVDESNDQDSRITALENQAAVGGNGEPCYPNNTCNAGLTCDLVTTVCELAAAVGGNGEPCYPNNTCDAGLTCDLVTTVCGP